MLPSRMATSAHDSTGLRHRLPFSWASVVIAEMDRLDKWPSVFSAMLIGSFKLCLSRL